MWPGWGCDMTFGFSGTGPVKLTDQPFTASGDLRVAELSPIFQHTFEYTVDNTQLFHKTITGGGTITQADAMAVVSSSTTSSSISCFQSEQHAKIRAGFGGVARFTALFTTPVAATEQLVGLSDELGSSVAFENGYMIGYIGTEFGFHRFQNDSLISVPQSEWDDPLDGTGRSGMTLDHTKLNVFFIQFQYLGAGAIRLFIENDATGDMILVNTVRYSNNFIIPSVFNPNFHITLFVDNKATSNDLIIKTASFSYFVEGKTKQTELHQTIFSSGEQQKTSVTTEVAIITIRNKSTYASKVNFVDVQIMGAYSSIEASAANNLGRVRFIKNAALGGIPVFNDINTTDSVIEFDIAGTTVTNGLEIFASPLAGKNDKSDKDLSPWNIILHPGDSLTIAGLSVNSATINSGLIWNELF